MSIDYKQLEAMVREAMAVDGPGGVMQPSGPAGVPHRMPAADGWDKVQDQGDPKANKLYDIALKAREATEKLVEALDDPTFDSAYEYAFKATSALRKALNAIVEGGAQPMPDQEVVAPPKDQQRWGGYVPYQGALDYGANGAAAGMMEQEDALKGFGAQSASAATHAKGATQTARDVASGRDGGGLDQRERAMLMQIQKIMTQVADEGDLTKFRAPLETVLKNLIKGVKKQK